MSDDGKTSWELDLDVKDAVSNVGELKEGLDKAFETENLESLISTITSLGVTAGIVGASILAIKESMDLVFEAETIDAVNKQFEILSDNAGIVGSSLKKGLEDAANGLVDTTTLLKDANSAIVKLGDGAERLPEIMELARKSSVLTGKDISTSFNDIIQAVTTGRTRMLASMGIIIDQKKAYDDYAKSMGILTSEMTKTNQQHAILNALLTTGKDNLAGIDPNLKAATTSWGQLKVALTEIGELSAVLWSKIAGPAVRVMLSDLADGAKKIRLSFVQMFGTGEEAADAKAQKLQLKLADLKKALSELKTGSHPIGDFLGTRQKAIKSLEAQIITTQENIKKSAIKNDAEEVKSGKTKEKLTKEQIKAIQDRYEKYQAEITKLRQKNLAEETKTAKSIEQVDALVEKQKAALQKKAFEDQKKFLSQKGVTNKQANAFILESDRQLANEIAALDEDLENKRIQALMNYAKESSNIAKAVGATWKAQSMKAEQEVEDFSVLGTTSFNAFQQNAVSALEAIGQGSQSAGDAMKGFMLNSLATIAQSEGALLLASALVNPLNGAAGAALIVLSGVLKAAAGSAGGSSGSVSTVTSSPGSAPTFSSTTGTTTGSASVSPQNLQQSPQSHVNVTIEGDYLNTTESQTALMDVIRQSTNVSDFNLYKVGNT